MSKDHEARIEQLEIDLAHAGRTIEDLNNVVVEQGKQIDRLTRLLEKMTDQVEELAEQAQGFLHISLVHSSMNYIHARHTSRKLQAIINDNNKPVPTTPRKGRPSTTSCYATGLPYVSLEAVYIFKHPMWIDVPDPYSSHEMGARSSCAPNATVASSVHFRFSRKTTVKKPQ